MTMDKPRGRPPKAGRKSARQIATEAKAALATMAGQLAKLGPPCDDCEPDVELHRYEPDYVVVSIHHAPACQAPRRDPVAEA